MEQHSNDERQILIAYHPSYSPKGTTLFELVPEPFRGYMELIRLHKPTGTILMFWPFAWGLTMSSFATDLPLQSYFSALALCICGAFIVRSSACTVNDIFDRKVDAGVERTSTRPLPSGRVSIAGAVLYLGVQYAAGIIFFYAYLDTFAFAVALFQLLPLFAIYPLLKRVTHWPQAWLGICMNFGLITAWMAVSSTPNYGVLTCLMAGCWCWTMLYDTIYACQDMRDDIKVGVRSTAILFGRWICPLLAACAVGFIVMLSVAGWLNGQGIAYYAISVGLTSVHLVWQLMTVDLELPASCWRNFTRNGKLGWLVWGGLFLDYLVAKHGNASLPMFM